MDKGQPNLVISNPSPGGSPRAVRTPLNRSDLDQTAGPRGIPSSPTMVNPAPIPATTASVPPPTPPAAIAPVSSWIQSPPVFPPLGAVEAAASTPQPSVSAPPLHLFHGGSDAEKRPDRRTPVRVAPLPPAPFLASPASPQRPPSVVAVSASPSPTSATPVNEEAKSAPTPSEHQQQEDTVKVPMPPARPYGYSEGSDRGAPLFSPTELLSPPHLNWPPLPSRVLETGAAPVQKSGLSSPASPPVTNNAAASNDRKHPGTEDRATPDEPRMDEQFASAVAQVEGEARQSEAEPAGQGGEPGSRFERVHDRFRVKGWKDVPTAVIFVAQVVTVFVMFVWTMASGHYDQLLRPRRILKQLTVFTREKNAHQYIAAPPVVVFMLRANQTGAAAESNATHSTLPLSMTTATPTMLVSVPGMAQPSEREGRVDYIPVMPPARQVWTTRRLIGIALLVIILSFGLSVLSIPLIQAYPRQMIIGCTVATLLFTVASGIYAFVEKAYIGGSICLAAALLVAYRAWSMRDRIPLSAVLLSFSCGLLRRFHGLKGMALLGTLFFTVYLIFWLIVLTPVTTTLEYSHSLMNGEYDLNAIVHSGGQGVTIVTSNTTVERYNNSTNRTINVTVIEFQVVHVPYPNAARGLLIFIVALLSVSAYWTVEVLSAVMHVTVAGIVATWYFAGRKGMPKSTTWVCAKRALTTSFGTCCLSAAFNGVVRWLEFITRASTGSVTDDIPAHHKPPPCLANCGATCTWIFAQCSQVSWIGARITQFFNTYALSHAAIYGDGYFSCARTTYHMMRTFFWPALINDVLTSAVFTLMALFNSVAAAGIVVAILGWTTPLFLGTMFSVGGVQLIIYRLVTGAVATLFVCLAEAPEVMYEINHEFYLYLQIAFEGYIAQNPRHKLPLSRLPTNAADVAEMRRRQAEIAATAEALKEKDKAADAVKAAAAHEAAETYYNPPTPVDEPPAPADEAPTGSSDGADRA